MPPVPTLKILMETMCSAVQLLVEVTVAEGRVLLRCELLCHVILSIVTVQNKVLKGNAFKQQFGKASLSFTSVRSS